MDSMQSLAMLMGWLLTNGFSMLVLLIGVATACVWWARIPRSAMLLLIASLLGLLAYVVTGWYYSFYLPQLVSSHGMTTRQVGYVNSILGFVAGLFHAAVYMLLIFAVVSGRKPPRQPPDPPWR